MTTSPAPDSRTRLLMAAYDEFAEHGLAGGRVDRIAESAGANKQLIYAYYGGKDQLFEAVLRLKVAGLIADVEFTADDLPSYAVRLMDAYVANPELLRLVQWAELERPGYLQSLPESADATRAKLSAMSADGRAGRSPRDLPDEALLDAVVVLAARSAQQSLTAATPRLRRRHETWLHDAVMLIAAGQGS